MQDGAGRSGFDIDVANAFATDLGLELVWVPFSWPALSEGIESGAFDVAMSGVTWRPNRAVSGWMTRAVASGGPCLLGDPSAPRVAVNRGGMLEAWSRAQLGDRELLPVDDNLSLPDLLSSGKVGAIVTDSFELNAFRRPGWAEQCEPPRLRKVYWVAPERAADLGPQLEAWLTSHAALIQAAQQRWFGAAQPSDAVTHLVDLLARRLELMPPVAAFKRAHNLPIEDAAREQRVLAAAMAQANALGFQQGAVRALFELQIELAKSVQQRSTQPSTLDLETELRPTLIALGTRIVAALKAAADSGRLAELNADTLELLSPWLEPGERQRLAEALLALAVADGPPPRPSAVTHSEQTVPSSGNSRLVK
jgi:chorismate mutase-like protein